MSTRFSEEDFEYADYYHDGKADRIAKQNDPEQEANARLIAAAPETAAERDALREAVDELSRYYAERNNQFCNVKLALQNLLTACYNQAHSNGVTGEVMTTMEEARVALKGEL